jgi:hypothetical protein
MEYSQGGCLRILPPGGDQSHFPHDGQTFYGYCFFHSIQPLARKPTIVSSLGGGGGNPRHTTGIRLTGMAMSDAPRVRGSLSGLWSVAQHGRSDSGRLASIPADPCLCPDSHRRHRLNRCQCHASGTATRSPCLRHPHARTEDRHYLSFFDRVNSLLADTTNILS